MEARAATRSDLAKVFRNLADRMAAEYKTAGRKNLAEAKQYFIERVDDGRAHALVDSGLVLAVIGWQFHDNAAYTSFAAVEGFFHPRFVRWFSRHLRTIQAGVGNLELRSMSYSAHPATQKWFLTLGFQEPRPEGKAMLYVLPGAALGET